MLTLSPTAATTPTWRDQFRAHESIEYNGKRIPVMVVSEVNAARGEGMEYILVDAAGRYFFRRELHDDALSSLDVPRTELPGYRCLVHRISLPTAILMQVTFGAKRILRSHAADLLSSITDRKRAPGADCVTVTLDEHCSAVARRCLRYNEHAPVHHMGDLVNAAVEFFADDTDQGTSTLDFVEQARARRLARSGRNGGPSGKTAVNIELSPTQLRMFQQIADYEPAEKLADVIVRELGQHVALHLECYHGHDLDAARERWTHEQGEVA